MFYILTYYEFVLFACFLLEILKLGLDTLFVIISWLIIEILLKMYISVMAVLINDFAIFRPLQLL